MDDVLSLTAIKHSLYLFFCVNVLLFKVQFMFYNENDKFVNIVYYVPTYFFRSCPNCNRNLTIDDSK